jgi:hypothetical protein
MVSADTAAASAATIVGAATSAAAPGEITDGKRAADLAPWITQFQEKLHERSPSTAFAPTTAPAEIMDSNKVADLASWITQLKERFKALDMERDARWAAQLKQHPTGLDAKGAAQREQTVQLERKNIEKQALLSNRDHKESRQIETVADEIDLRSA